MPPPMRSLALTLLVLVCSCAAPAPEPGTGESPVVVAALDALWRDLSSGDPVARRAAVDGFERLAAPASRYLRAHLHETTDPESRLAAVEALAGAGDGGEPWRALEASIAALADAFRVAPDAAARSHVLEALLTVDWDRVGRIEEIRWTGLWIARLAAGDADPRLRSLGEQLEQRLGGP